MREADKQKTQLLAQLEKQNKEDGLTGLFNRRYLDQRLAEEFRRAQRHRRSLAVALADLDYFKRINDRLSHAVGDEVLRNVARIFRANVRETDVVARYGGEEFALMFLEMDMAGAARRDKIRQAVEDYDWRRIHPELAVTISIGVSDDASVSRMSACWPGRYQTLPGQIQQEESSVLLNRRSPNGFLSPCVGDNVTR